MSKESKNLLAAVRFEKPEYIPMDFHISGACWNNYPQDALLELMADHPVLFPDFDGSVDKVIPACPLWERAGQIYTDPWGCVRRTSEDGIVGIVTEHPLASWDNFADFRAPQLTKDPQRWLDNRNPVKGKLKSGGLRHGHTFLTLVSTET